MRQDHRHPGPHRPPADHEGAGHFGAVEGLLLEADPDEVGGDVGAADARGHVDIVAQPVDGDAHQISNPNWASKRTSPSIMSRMSETPVRNISARSIPIPNANPV
mgnify:CR=1 FL=1